MREPIMPAGGARPGGAYSPGIAIDELVFTAGQGPANPETGEIPEGIEAQTEAAIQNTARILDAAGCTLADVVKSTVHLADLGDFARFDKVYASIFPEPRPARTTVGSQLLGILIEIDVIAVRRR